MLLSREEMTFDFGGAKLEPARDRQLLAWMMNQFLYGEVSGIQIGHWLYHAPDLESARFLAKQALEEFQHVDNFVRILAILGEKPARPNGTVRFLATGMMGGSWAEHVALEMASGEGFVLMCFYAIIDTLAEPAAVAILERAVKQEERHVEFGEEQTRKLIESDPGLRRRLLGLSLVWMWGVRRIARHLATRSPQDHPVLGQLAKFAEKTLACAELRLRRIGLLEHPLAELSPGRRRALVLEAYLHKFIMGFWRLLAAPFRLLPGVPTRKLLTDTYLEDPAVCDPVEADRLSH